MSTDKRDAMRAIRDEVLKLVDSPLYSYRTKNNYYPVIGEGNHDAAIVFVGEAPGKNEAERARPFCGAAGRILDEVIASLGIERDDVYITNIVKDRPPENRDPTPEEIALYAPFLDRQIEIIEPSVVATLGRFSMEYVLKRYGAEDTIQPISRLHGTEVVLPDEYGFVVMPLYHPAVALYNASEKETLLADVAKLKPFCE